MGAQIALARRESSDRRVRHICRWPVSSTRKCRTASTECVRVCCSERRALIISRGISHLDAIDRRAVDAERCAEPLRLAGWSDNRFEAETRKLADILDVEARLKRNTIAESQQAGDRPPSC